MNKFDRQWQKLAALARQAPAGDGSAPYGFATRLAAAGLAAPAEGAWPGFGRYARRGLLVAAMVCVAAVALNLPAVFGSRDDEVELDDAIVQVLDLS
ncbi:MAG: hypothetical protein HY302_10635 [Opitutae bacterium]|nr:hypothetical protein [Opitutae bacterium]